MSQVTGDDDLVGIEVMGLHMGDDLFELFHGIIIQYICRVQMDVGNVNKFHGELSLWGLAKGYTSHSW